MWFQRCEENAAENGGWQDTKSAACQIGQYGWFDDCYLWGWRGDIDISLEWKVEWYWRIDKGYHFGKGEFPMYGGS